MTIPNVNAGDPLDPAWGDAVADLLNGATATSYTPTLGGSGWAIGNGTLSGQYVQAVGRVWFVANVVFGSTSTFGAGAPLLGLPVAASSTWIGSESLGFTGVGVDISDSSKQYDLRGVSNSTTAFSVYARNASGTYLQVTPLSSTVPFTWASTDQIRFIGSYFV